MTCRCGDRYCSTCGVDDLGTDWICRDNHCSEPVENAFDYCKEHTDTPQSK